MYTKECLGPMFQYVKDLLEDDHILFIDNSVIPFVHNGRSHLPMDQMEISKEFVERLASLKSPRIFTTAAIERELERLVIGSKGVLEQKKIGAKSDHVALLSQFSLALGQFYSNQKERIIPFSEDYGKYERVSEVISELSYIFCTDESKPRIPTDDPDVSLIFLMVFKCTTSLTIQIIM